ncbi:latrophilin-like protein 2, partial [Aphelenchoides avenae]
MEIRAPAGRQCVSLHGSSSFRDWHIESCDSLNFFVCQRAETNSTEVNLWPVQCQCPEGFFGRYCEVPTNITEQGVSPESYACADEVFLYSCPSGSTIVVDYALYGHIEGEENKGSCIAEDYSTTMSDVTCIDSGSLRSLVQRCEGLSFCQFDHGGDVADARSDVVYPMVFSALLARNFTDTANFWIKSAQLEAKLRSRGAVGNFTGEGMECLSVSMHSQETRPEPCQLQLGWICEFPPTSHVDVRVRQIMETPTKSTSTKPGVDGPPVQPITDPVPATVRGRPDDPTLLTCEETVQQGYALPLTRACESVELPCNGRNMEGVARWACGCSNGEWSRHSEGCRHRWLAELETDFNATTATKRDARQISEKLADALRTALREGEFSGGDIVGCIWLSREVLSIAGEQVRRMTRFDEKRNFSLNFAELFGSAGDQLLSDAAMEAWRSLPNDERVEQAAALMQALQKSMLILSEGVPVGENAQLDFDHWASKMEVKQLIPQNKMQASPPRGVQASRTSAFIGPGASSFSPVQDVKFAGRANAPTMQLPSDDLLRYSAMNSYFGVFAHAIAPLADAPATENKLKVGTFMYTSLENLLQTEPTRIVNSHIVGAFVNDPSTSMNISQQPASFTFYHLRKLGVSNPTCVYWKVADNKWDDAGCMLVETNDEYTKCSCNHLTSFAILMDFYGDVEESLSPVNSAILEAITVFGCSLSATCLFVCVVVFTAYRSLYNMRNTLHRHVCIALFFANVLFVLGLALKGTSSCSVIAVLLHLFLLSAFMWMLLEGCHLYMMLVQVFEASHKRLILYYLVGYGIPFVTVLTSLLVGEGHKNYGTLDACWINTRSATKWAFIIPVTVVVSLNTTVLFIALRVVMSVRRERTNAERISGWLKGSAMLLCLLGTTWIFGYLVNVPDSSTRVVFSYIFTVLNTLQGLFIFVLHVLMNDKVRNTALRSMRKGVCCSEDPLSSFSSRGQLFSRKSFLVRLWKFRESSSATGNTTGSTEAKRLSNEGKNASAQARELEKKL